MGGKIHILGAAGSGTSTLGEALSESLPHKHLDTDDYFWIEKFTKQREVADRRKMLENDLLQDEEQILSGAVCGWGDDFKTYFDVVIYLWIPEEIRLERLQQREFARYGDEVLIGGSRYKQSQEFLEWAALYDSAGMEVRSKTLHEHWMKDISPRVLRIEGNYSVKERIDIVLEYLKSRQFKHL